jgi:hypothetical protein
MLYTEDNPTGASHERRHSRQTSGPTFRAPSTLLGVGGRRPVLATLCVCGPAERRK